MNASVNWTGYKTIVRKEVTRILRIWAQTVVPPAITMTLYFIIFGNLIGRRIGDMGGLVVMVISLFFTRVEVQHPLIMVSVLLMTSVVFAMAGMVNAIFANKFDDIAIVPTFILTPLTYLGGVFYSISLLPEFWQKVSAFNPILYMVNGFRYGILGVSDVEIGYAYIIMIVFAVTLASLCLWLLHKGYGLRS